jgi:hypothetical protein
VSIVATGGGPPGGAAGLGALRRFAAAARPAVGDRCELCGIGLAERHDHVLEVARGLLRCSCLPCAATFDADGPIRRVPGLVARLAAPAEAAWLGLGLPVEVAFFCRRGEALVAGFPGPAGVAETAVNPAAFAAAFPAAADLVPEIEAVLIDRRRGGADGRGAAFRVSIDECFHLVGLMRRGWRGLSGGDEVWSTIAGFFAELEGRGG